MTVTSEELLVGPDYLLETQSETLATVIELGRFLTAGTLINTETNLTKSLFEDLKPEQIKEIELASRGLTAKQVGAELFLAEKTVKNYRSLIIKHVGAQNMPNVIGKACKDKLFTDKLDGIIIAGEVTELMRFDLHMLASGYEEKEAGAIRGVSYRTVRNGRQRTRQIIGAKNNSHAVRIAYETGLLPLRGES